VKILGRIIRLRSVERKVFCKNGVTIVFDTPLGEITRTYNIPSAYNKRNELVKFLNSVNCKVIPISLIDKPNLFCLALEKHLLGIECNLVLAETGKPNYPYDVIEANPILTVEL
jgi:hypothetical protein